MTTDHLTTHSDLIDDIATAICNRQGESTVEDYHRDDAEAALGVVLERFPDLGPLMPHVCALCLHAPDTNGSTPRLAITTVNGFEVCAEHVPIVAAGAQWAVIVNAMKRAQPLPGL